MQVRNPVRTATFGAANPDKRQKTNLFDKIVLHTIAEQRTDLMLIDTLGKSNIRQVVIPNRLRLSKARSKFLPPQCLIDFFLKTIKLHMDMRKSGSA